MLPEPYRPAIGATGDVVLLDLNQELPNPLVWKPSARNRSLTR